MQYEMIVINNGNDKDISDILSTRSNIVEIKNETNVGVCHSWNQGVKKSKFENICICNNDIEFITSNVMYEMNRVLVNDRSVLYTSPATCYQKDQTKRIFKPYHYEQLRYSQFGDTYVVGCCFMCPRRAFAETIGFFDEKFAMRYYEDLDYINRILKSGNRVMMTQSALIYHAVGVTSRYITGGESNEAYYKEKWGSTGFDILAMNRVGRGKGIKHFNSDLL